MLYMRRVYCSTSKYITNNSALTKIKIDSYNLTTNTWLPHLFFLNYVSIMIYNSSLLFDVMQCKIKHISEFISGFFMAIGSGILGLLHHTANQYFCSKVAIITFFSILHHSFIIEPFQKVLIMI